MKERSLSSDAVSDMGLRLECLVSVPQDTSCCLVASDDVAVYLAFRYAWPRGKPWRRVCELR